MNGNQIVAMINISPGGYTECSVVTTSWAGLVMKKWRLSPGEASDVLSDLCELLHEVTGSTIPPSGGASG